MKFTDEVGMNFNQRPRSWLAAGGSFCLKVRSWNVSFFYKWEVMVEVRAPKNAVSIHVGGE